MTASARLVYLANDQPEHCFSELDHVRATRLLKKRDGSFIDKGARGVVLLVLGQGAAYEVEFGDQPIDLITVNVDDLEPADTAA